MECFGPIWSTSPSVVVSKTFVSRSNSSTEAFEVGVWVVVMVGLILEIDTRGNSATVTSMLAGVEEGRGRILIVVTTG